MYDQRISTCARPGTSGGPSGRSTRSVFAREMRYNGASGASSRAANDPPGGKTMTVFRRFLFVIAATVGLAASAWAEGIFPVNDAGTGNWVFDQPSVVASGTVLHVAFVGDSAARADNADGTVNASLNTRLYYAAVNGGVNFKDRATTRTAVLLTPPVAIDNGDAYTNARHPHIAVRTSTELVILFQAIPVGETSPKLFRARVTIGTNTVTSSH